ncbi:MAG: MarR family transcriptional regulator, partial [Planctomycetota bacterium]
QYNVLRILRGEGKPMPALEVAGRMIQAVPAMTGLIDRLEKQGHVARRRSEEDRRVVFIELTKRGRHTLGKIDEPLSGLHAETLGHMKKKDLTALTGLLENAAEGLPRE